MLIAPRCAIWFEEIDMDERQRKFSALPATTANSLLISQVLNLSPR